MSEPRCWLRERMHGVVLVLLVQHSAPGDFKINICVRKRPVSKKEIDRRDYDAVR